MIKHVSIKNFAIIDEANIDFSPSLTVITGETGSGKSILLQAIGVATGGKTTKTMIKSGEDRSMVEVECSQGTFRRVLFGSGAVKSYSDEEPVKNADLLDRTSRLLDFHGQHDQQLIMDPKNHILYLDRFSGISEKVNELSKIFVDLKQCRDELKVNLKKLENSRDKIELLEFQKNEIESVSPKPNEDEELDIEYRKLNNIDKIQNTIKVIQEYVLQQDNSISDQLSQAVKDLNSIARYSPDLESVADQVEDALVSIQDAINSAVNIAESSELDPYQLQEYSDRIQALETLKRKYGGSIEAVVERLESINSELSDLENIDINIDGLKKKIKLLQNSYSQLALELHTKRVSMISELSKKIESEMASLNMPGSRFEIRLEMNLDLESFFEFEGKKVKINPDGFDTVSFYLSANPGEIPKPLAEIASGGEISRIMLAIKTVFNEMDPVETLIFDEIDTGISGNTAEKVAKALKDLSKNKQVICITHLPQIAAQADNHLHVSKSVNGNSTSVSFKYVSGDEKEKLTRQLYSG